MRDDEREGVDEQRDERDEQDVSQQDLGEPLPAAPPSAPRPLDRWWSPTDGREMVYLPPGRFTMGSDLPEADDDEVAHRVRIASGIWMDVSPVTNEEFQAFLVAEPMWRKDRIPAEYRDDGYLADWADLDYPDGQGDHPVCHVSWFAARAYAEWTGKRLPTEAEWEYACRAGTTSRYWWGDSFDRDLASVQRTAVDTSRHVNPWGLVDITGNVWEWTASLYDAYPYDAADGREDEDVAGERVLRGGGWPDDASVLRSSFREREMPVRCIEDVGFRCVWAGGVAQDDEATVEEGAGRRGEAEAVEADGQELEEAGEPATEVVGRDGRPAVWVPAGSFEMGSPDDEEGREDQEVGHRVRIGRGFWLDRCLVTRADYRQFLVENDAWTKGGIDRRLHDGRYLQDWDGLEFPAGTGDHPVVFVSWHAARAYAAWAGKRLPTEAEWEYACRAGTVTAYWWGDEFDPARAHHGQEAPDAVGAPMRTNGWGLADMLGNVWEWTSSALRPYPYRPADGREWGDTDEERVVRGGTFASPPWHVRAAVRDGFGPSTCRASIGFRCASDLDASRA